MPPSVAYAPIQTLPPGNSPAPTLPPTPIATLFPTLTAYPQTATPAPTLPIAKTGTLADRYGLIVTGTAGDAAQAIAHIADATGARWWYQYTPDTPAVADATLRQVRLLRFGGTPQTGPQLDPLRAVIVAAPHNGGYWLIGNEPNVEGRIISTPTYTLVACTTSPPPFVPPTRRRSLSARTC